VGRQDSLSGCTRFGRHGGQLLRALCALLLLVPGLAAAHAPSDNVFRQVGVDEQLGQVIPLQLPFRDQFGTPVRLENYFAGTPVLLSLNYYACPTLCPLVFRNLAATVTHLSDFRLERDFRIVTVSINPDETFELARTKSATTYAMLGGAAGTGGWPFLLGSATSIAQLAQSLGVRYLKLESGEYAHPNVLVVLTPTGRVSRYLYGLEIRPRDLRLALTEAAQGRIGSSPVINNLLLYCYHYDPVGKKYVLFASRLMTVAMLGVLVLMLAMLALLWKKEKGGKPARK
jgi:protein SCO1